MCVWMGGGNGTSSSWVAGWGSDFGFNWQLFLVNIAPLVIGSAQASALRIIMSNFFGGGILFNL